MANIHGRSTPKQSNSSSVRSWHLITQEGWYAIKAKRPNLNKPTTCCLFHLPVFHGFHDEFWFYWISWTFSDNLLSRFVGPYHWPFFNQSSTWLYFFSLLCFPWRCVDQCTINQLFFLLLCGIISVLWKTVNRICVVRIFQSIARQVISL